MIKVHQVRRTPRVTGLGVTPVSGSDVWTRVLLQWGNLSRHFTTCFASERQSTSGQGLRIQHEARSASLCVFTSEHPEPSLHRLILLAAFTAPVWPSSQSHASVGVLQDGGFQCSVSDIIASESELPASAGGLSWWEGRAEGAEPGCGVASETRKLSPHGLCLRGAGVGVRLRGAVFIRVWPPRTGSIFGGETQRFPEGGCLFLSVCTRSSFNVTLATFGRLPVNDGENAVSTETCQRQPL